MIAIPMQVTATQYDIIVVLEDINIDRMKKYDPAVIDMDKFKSVVGDLKIREVVLLYANEEETRRLSSSTGGDDSKEILRSLIRGYEDHPELGDNKSTGEYQRMNNN